MRFLSQDELHVNDKCAKSQAQKAYAKNQEHPNLNVHTC
jgi:hypothetical protein